MVDTLLIDTSRRKSNIQLRHRFMQWVNKKCLEAEGYLTGNINLRYLDMNTRLLPNQFYRENQPDKRVQMSWGSDPKTRGNCNIAFWVYWVTVDVLVPSYGESRQTYFMGHEQAHAATYFGFSRSLLEKAVEKGCHVGENDFEAAKVIDTLMEELAWTLRTRRQPDPNWQRNFSERMHQFENRYGGFIERVGMFGSEIAIVNSGLPIWKAYVLHIAKK